MIVRFAGPEFDEPEDLEELGSQLDVEDEDEDEEDNPDSEILDEEEETED